MHTNPTLTFVHIPLKIPCTVRKVVGVQLESGFIKCQGHLVEILLLIWTNRLTIQM